MNNSKYPPHGAFYPDYKKIEAIANIRARKFEQVEIKLRKGALTDFSMVDQFISELEDMGTDNLVTEVQKQLDAVSRGK